MCHRELNGGISRVSSNSVSAGVIDCVNGVIDWAKKTFTDQKDVHGPGRHQDTIPPPGYTIQPRYHGYHRPLWSDGLCSTVTILTSNCTLPSPTYRTHRLPVLSTLPVCHIYQHAHLRGRLLTNIYKVYQSVKAGVGKRVSASVILG